MLPKKGTTRSRKPRARQDRYDLSRARAPSGGRGDPARSGNVDLGIAAVQDPYDSQEELSLFENRRVSPLHWERSHLRLTEPAFQTGLKIQQLFERTAKVGPGGQWSDASRVDAADRHEDAMAYGVASARQLLRAMAVIRLEIGRDGVEFLSHFLRDRMSYTGYAAHNPYVGGGKRGPGIVAQRFRWTLEVLAKRAGLYETLVEALKAPDVKRLRRLMAAAERGS